MTVYSNQRVFRCDVGANILTPTHDPDRPHCVMVNMHNYINDYTGTTWETDFHARVTYHSKYPIYPHYFEDSSGSYVCIVFFSTQSYPPGSDPTKCELLYEIDSDSIVASDYDTGRNRFQAHNYGYYADREIRMDYDPQTDKYTNVSRMAYDPFTLRVDRPSEAGNRLLRFEQRTHYFTPQSTTFPTILQSAGIDVWWYYGRSDSTSRYFPMSNHDSDNGYIEYHSRYSLYNFNNPLFASGQAWLDYCKEQV